MLLIDDIQFLAGKNSTQEEFFHTFNELHNHDKQIVIAADKSPKQIEGLENRLTSRFVWGLCTDIQKPDVETRIAILQKKAALESLLIPPKIIVELAEKFDSNVRDLEGAFIRVVARAHLMNKSFERAFTDLEVDDKKSRQSNAIITQETPQPKSNLSLQEIVDRVAAYFAISTETLMTNLRSQRIVRPRQIAMYLCRELTATSWLVLAKFFGKRDHATIIRAYQKIHAELQINPQLTQLLKNIFPEVNF